MYQKKYIILILIVLGISVIASGCDEGPCMVTGTQDLTVYRLPLTGSDVFGTLPAGEPHEVLARTADGWIGFDPGVAQAGNQGLARHRWIQLNATLSPFCLVSVPLVTLGDVEHDMGINNLNPPDLVITAVNLPSTQIEENISIPIEVTVENQGGGPSSGYEIFVFPHYDKGPQNPAEQDVVPDLAPGASHTFYFSPGVMYDTPGDYILRVLVTDNWNEPGGGPNSTGTNGDIEDIEIHVNMSLCFPFADLEVSLVLLNLPSDTRILPIYLSVEEGIFPGFEPENDISDQYLAMLGTIPANLINQQGYPNRAYFMFPIPPGEEGTAKYFELRLRDCEDPVFVQADVLIPIPKTKDSNGLTCTTSLDPEQCRKAGGEMSDSVTTGPVCVCP